MSMQVTGTSASITSRLADDDPTLARFYQIQGLAAGYVQRTPSVVLSELGYGLVCVNGHIQILQLHGNIGFADNAVTTLLFPCLA